MSTFIVVFLILAFFGVFYWSIKEIISINAT